MLYTKFKSLSFTIRSGEPLAPALKRLKGKFKKTAEFIEDGHSLKDSSQKAGFEPRIVNLLNAGELTGELDSTLDYLTDFYEMLYRYKKSITFSFLRAMLFIVGGTVAVYIFKEMFIQSSNRGLFFSFAGLSILFTFIYLIILILTPGFQNWTIFSTLKFCVKSGLSFVETKKLCRELKLPVKSGVKNFFDLFSYPKKYKPLIMSGEETGELEEVFKTLEKESFQELTKKLRTISNLFFYTGVVISMGFILFSIATVFSDTFSNLDV